MADENEDISKLSAEEIAELPVDQQKKAKAINERELRESERLKAVNYDQTKEIEKLKYLLEKANEEKRKPGIQVVEDDGKYNKRKRKNSSGLSDLMLPPFTKNMVAIYKIIGTDEINPATGLPVEAVDSSIPGRYIIHDKFDPDPLKRDKVMKNLGATERYIENGAEKTRETINDVIFYRGWLQVSVKDQYPLYVFMELHPMNKNNRFRPRNAVAAFERVDIKHKSKLANDLSTEIALDAGQAVRGLGKDEVYAYCATTVPPIITMGRDINEVRADLIRYAMNNPIDFFRQNKDMTAAVKVTVADAFTFGIIDYRREQRTYMNAETDEPIYTHTIQEDPMAGLIKFLSKKENQAIYHAIVDRMNYWGDE